MWESFRFPREICIEMIPVSICGTDAGAGATHSDMSQPRVDIDVLFYRASEHQSYNRKVVSYI